MDYSLILPTILTSGIISGIVTTVVNHSSQKRLKGFDVRIAYYKEEYDRIKDLVNTLNEDTEFTIIKDGKISLEGAVSYSTENHMLTTSLYSKNHDLYTSEDIKLLDEILEERSKVYIELVTLRKLDENNKSGSIDKHHQDLTIKLVEYNSKFEKKFNQITRMRLLEIKSKLEKA